VGDQSTTSLSCWRAIAVHLAGIQVPPITCQLTRCLVTEYKFRIGQLVYFHPKGMGRSQVDAVPGLYQITKRLPAAEDGECQCEIRNTLEEYNRVARESDLTRA
jgi:hypothetical protein